MTIRRRHVDIFLDEIAAGNVEDDIDPVFQSQLCQHLLRRASPTRAVIGVADSLKGQSPLGLLCLNKGVDRDPAEVVRECVALVRDRIGPVADFKRAVVVDRLPKTRSGKILRATMVKIADGQDWKMPATIDDPAILDEITQALRGLGLAGAKG